MSVIHYLQWGDYPQIGDYLQIVDYLQVVGYPQVISNTSVSDYLSLPLCQLSRTGSTAECAFALFHLPLKIPF